MSGNKTTSLSDIPFDEDVNDFGTESYVKGLINFIENSSAPITIALQGEWGSGKTSLMNRLKRALCDGEGSAFIGVEVNTWEYSMMSSPETSVLNIITHLVKSLSKDDASTKHTLNNFLKKTGNTVWRGLREGMKAIPIAGPAAAIAVEMSGLTNQVFDEESNGAKEDVALSDLKAALERSVAAQIGNGKRGVIVFVDDLDRLNPPVAVEILELLKNIFCIKNCIFVLAIDYEVVVKGLEPKFGKLTEQNEREFRSFFDKIIQVPFSLPVSSYRPMDFVLDSLVSIGYITDVEKKSDDRIRVPFSRIVDKSVGKNPRSIKRLLNTLSLLRCIAKYSKRDKDSAFFETCEGRIVNFAIVAIQVCYPKIYRMLVMAPDFRKWDSDLATKLNVKVEVKEGEPAIGWEDVLMSACNNDKYLTQHYRDILNLLELIKDTLCMTRNNGEDNLGSRIRSVIDKSSVTEISEPVTVGEVDQKRLIYALHDNVVACIQEKRPDINSIQKKRNTGNGGFYVYMSDAPGDYIEIVIRPEVAPDKVRCEFWVSTGVFRPQSLMGKSWDEMMAVPEVSRMMNIMEDCVAPLLNNTQYFEGMTHPDQGLTTYFKSFIEEQKWRNSQGWNMDLICNDLFYYINLANESQFSDPSIVKAIADMIIAIYDFRMAAKQIPSNETQT